MVPNRRARSRSRTGIRVRRFASAYIRTRVDARKGAGQFLNYPLQNLRFFTGRQCGQKLLEIGESRHTRYFNCRRTAAFQQRHTTIVTSMRTTIVIDDKLMRDALRATGVKTKREVVELGLRTLLRLSRRGKTRYGSENIHRAVFGGSSPAKPSTDGMKEGIRQSVSRRHSGR